MRRCAATSCRPALTGLAPDGGGVCSIGLVKSPFHRVDELLAFRSYEQPAMLRSRDGLSWQEIGPLPEDADPYGQLEMAAVDEAVILVADATSSRGYGNAMNAWRIEPDGDTPLTYERQPAFAESIVASGPTVLVLGHAWGPGSSDGDDVGEYWGWIIGSRDGGRTWDPDLAWTGSAGRCLGRRPSTGRRSSLRRAITTRR